MLATSPGFHLADYCDLESSRSWDFAAPEELEASGFEVIEELIILRRETELACRQVFFVSEILKTRGGLGEQRTGERQANACAQNLPHQLPARQSISVNVCHPRRILDKQRGQDGNQIRMRIRTR